MQNRPQSKVAQSAGHSRPKPIDPFTRGYVAKCARQLIGSHGFLEADQGDIEQSLLAKLSSRLDQANPDDPKWRAFVSKTVSRHIATLIRDRVAPKRDDRKTCSIHIYVSAGEEGPVELGSVVGNRDVPSRLHQEAISDLESTELRHDVASCIDRLADPRYRELCRHLMHGTIAEAARAMQIPRTTIDSWIPKIRRRFEAMGLSNYSQNSSSFR